MAALSFRTVNDTIRGGGSQCEIKYLPTQKCTNFFGRTSFVRGGGWASVRSPRMNGELLGTHGMLVLSSSTDCNKYKIVCKTKACRNTEACLWHTDFYPSTDATGCWRVMKLPYEKFSPILKGMPCDPGGPLHPEAIEVIGMMISNVAQDGSDSHISEGDFDLKIKWIRGYFASLTLTDSPLLPAPKSPMKDGVLVTSGPLQGEHYSP